jgi:hypothetical protein
VARAKRTERAEARRRYRAALATDATIDAELDEATAPEDVGGRSGSRFSGSSANRAGARDAVGGGSRSSSAPFQRVGFLEAFRVAARPASIRSDLAALPELIRTRAVLVPGLIAVVMFVVVLIPGLAAYDGVRYLGQTLLISPGLILPFLAGILARRAAWLCGAVIGLLTAVLYGVFLVVSSDSTLLNFFFAAPPVPSGFREAQALQSLLLGIPVSAGIGAFAGFYRRFLRLSGPGAGGGQRPRRQTARSRAR